jgi:hypothetical protein
MASASLDELDNYIDFGDSSFLTSAAAAEFSIEDGFTAEAWIQYDSGDTTDSVIMDLASSGDQFYLKTEAVPNSTKQRLIGYAFDSATNIQVVNYTACGVIEEGSWHHVAISLDSDSYNCYLNGVEVGQIARANTTAQFSERIQFGKWTNSGSDNSSGDIDGYIDQIKIWDSVLSEQAIAASMHVWGIPTQDLNGNSLNLAGQLKHHYDFNGDGPVALEDKVGSADLTLTGSASYPHVATSTTSGTTDTVSFTRSYLTSNGGWKVPSGVTSATSLVVGGGGGGGAWVGGGGGGGGVIEQSVALTSSGYARIQVGQGGTGGARTASLRLASNGQPSVVTSSGSLRALGGGAGSSPGFAAGSGSSVAGGGGGHAASGTFGGGAGSISSGGSAHSDNQPHAVGGGGGAGGNGISGSLSGSTYQSGNGGPGLSSSIFGTSQFFGGGGGGSAHGTWFAPSSWNSSVEVLPGLGGTGGGANGARVISSQGPVSAASGSPNTGGGGGGSASFYADWDYEESLGGSGGSGLVVLRYSTFVSAPQNLVVSPGAVSLSLSWDPPSEQGNIGITGYRVDYSTDGSNWTPAPGSASSTSYSITGLTAGTAYYVRVAALTGAGLGPWGYPWTEIFRTTNPVRVGGQIVYSSGFGLSDNSVSLTRTDFTRVRYRLEAKYLTSDAAPFFADVDFEKTLTNRNSSSNPSEQYTDLSRLQVPIPTAGSSQFELHGSVSDLNVVSNHVNVTKIYGATGRVEIWPWDYNPEAATGLADNLGNGAVYDYADNHISDGGYGSFQVHNLGSSPHTVFAWNQHQGTASNVDIGFGNSSGAHPDWTFAGGSSLNFPRLYSEDRSAFKFQSFANLATATLTGNTISFKQGTFGTGDDYVIGKATGSSVTLPLSVQAQTLFTRPDFEVGGWSTDPNGATSTYTLGATYSTNANLILYPFWVSSLMAYETFDTTSNLGGYANAATGGGFTGSWSTVFSGTHTGAAAQTLVSQGTSNDLPGTYPPGAGIQISSTSRAVGQGGSGPNLRQNARQLSSPISMDQDRTFYVSFLSQASISVQQMVGFMDGLPSSSSDTSKKALLFGLAATNPSQLAIDYGSANRLAGCPDDAVVACGSPSLNYSAITSGASVAGSEIVNSARYGMLYVARISASASGSDTIQLKRIRYFDGVPLNDSGISWDLTYSTPITGNFTHLTVQNYAAGYPLLDELRVAETYEKLLLPKATVTADFRANYVGAPIESATQLMTQNISTPKWPSFARTGYTQTGWNTDPDGVSGVSYPIRPSLANSETLYATWQLNTYNVNYARGLTGTGLTQTTVKTHGVDIQLADFATASGWFTRAGHEIVGWSTSSSGSPLAYALGATYSVNSGTTLFPVWSAAENAQPASDYSIDFAGTSRARASVGSVASPVAVIPDDSSFTWEAWLKPSTGSGVIQAHVLNNISGSDLEGTASLRIDNFGSGGAFVASYDDQEVGVDGALAATSYGLVSYSQWQHVAVTYERTGAAAGSCSGLGALTITIYVNGVQRATSTDSSFNGCLDSSGLSIGDPGNNLSADNNKFFKGSLDQVKVWGGALSQSQVQQSMAAYAAGTVGATLVSHYSFNELGSSPVSGDSVNNLASSSTSFDLALTSPTASNVAANVTRSLNSFTLSFNGNGATSGSVSSISSRPYQTASVPTHGNLTWLGRSFDNWNTLSGGGGVSYAAASTYAFSYRDQDLFAQWTSTQSTATPTLSYPTVVFLSGGTLSKTMSANGHDGVPTFSTSTSNKCTVDPTSGEMTIVEAGTCAITASFPETSNYSAASVEASFEITRSNQEPLIWNQSTISYDYLGNIDLSTVISGGSGNGAVTFVDNNVANGCRVTGTVLSGGNAGTSCSITVTKGASVNFNAITLTQSITINQIAQSAISIANPGAQVFGQTVQLSSIGGSGTGAVTFNSTSSSICTETSEGEFEFIGVGDCVVSVSKAADTNYLDATSSSTIAVGRASHTLSFTSVVPASPVTGGTYTVSGVSSTADSALAPLFRVVAGSTSICSLSGNTVTFNLDGVCDIEAYRDSTSNYNAAPTSSQRIVVGQANQNISFAALGNKTFGDPAFTLSATSSSSNSVTFSRGSNTTNNACSVTSAGLVVIAGVGACEVVADSASGNGFAAASSVARTFEVSADSAGAPFITAVSFGDQSLTATYFAPSYLGGGTISGYRLQAHDPSVTDDLDTDVDESLVSTNSSCASSGTLSCTISGLTNGTSYTLKIAAITEAGLGAVSPASSAMTPAATPEAVTALTAVQGDQKLTLTWRAPNNLGGGAFFSFLIYYREAGGSFPATPEVTLYDQGVSSRTENGVTSLEITGLTNGQAYDVRVVTVTTANLANLTSATTEVTQTPYTVPDAPLSVTVLDMPNDIVITWSQPVFDGGSAIDGYSVLLNSVVATCAATSATSCTISKNTLTPGTTINIGVKAENDAGYSAPANTSFQVASAAVLVPPVVVTPGSPITGPAAGIEAVEGQTWAWTKRISANQVKVYIKFPEMGSNYQIKLQKNDGKWSRKMSKTITSTSDADLLVVGDAYYLVRTVELPGEGQYRIQITESGDRITLNGKDRPAVYNYR